MARDTVGDAARENVTGFQLYCWQKCERGYPCRHSWKWGIMHALVLWGAEREMRSLRFVCTRCGGRNYTVEFYKPPVSGTGHMCAIKNHESMYRYHWRDLWRHGYNIQVI